MSDEAYKVYEEALKEQHNRNEARRIRTKVNEARMNPFAAGMRWPFELLQNALDSGPRRNKPLISIRLWHEESKVVFEHDAAPFSSDDLAALLSGGSSKEFDSDVTTGRFGTGFLVTHVLDERTKLQGLLEVGTGIEQFDLILDRSGDEDAILENIQLCSESIRSAKQIDSLEKYPSAKFEYHIEEDNSVVNGIDVLKKALPYLFATWPMLGSVEIKTIENGKELWTIQDSLFYEIEGGFVEQRSLRIRSDDDTFSDLRVYRFLTNKDGTASALVLAEQSDKGWKVKIPERDTPRIYREYPLSGSGFLPLNLILNGKFGPDQERRRVLMSDQDKELLEEAFEAAVVAVKFASDQRWENAHLLARSWKPTSVFDSDDEAEKRWWTNHLAEFAERLSRLPIVECNDGFLPSNRNEEEYADFVVPRLLLSSAENETTVERMWPLVEASKSLCPPREDLAADWSEIAEGWYGLGVEINRISIDKLAQEVREEAETLEELDITWDFKIWLAHFLDIVGQCWETRHGIELSVLTSILPDQKRRLRSPSELSRDSGVSDSLKNICENFGLDFRSRLLLSDFDDIVKNKDLKYLNSMIKDAVSKKISEEEVIEEAVMHLNGELPEDEECKPGTEDIQKGTAQLLTYIWETKQNPTLIKHRIPLITSKQRSVRWSPDRIMMAPICSWNESAKPFADAYPPNRVLADFYDNSQDDEIRNCLHALVEWGIAYPDPIITVEPAELRERRLDAISSVDTDGITVNNQKFSQIALLQPEVLNRCQEGVEEARALLGLVLCYIAPHDPEWQEDRIVKGRRAGEDIDIPMRGALWLADLKFRAWVPVPGEDEKMTKMVANAATLKHLLNPAWLQNNDAAIKLLSDWFEFDQLDLQLLGITPDEEKRRELRNSLAKLVESGGPDPEFYTSLLESIEADHRRRRDIARFRRLGIAVQEAIKSAMENYDLNLELVDRGFDYEVTSSMDNVLEDSAIILEVGPYLLEVKSTTQENVYLTPLQAITASEEASRYVLCVVDLHSLSDEDLDAEWTGARVEPLAKIVTDIGHRIGETCSLVEAAKHKSVAIRNESALRYEVSLNIWGLGTSILSWVESIYNDSK